MPPPSRHFAVAFAAAPPPCASATREGEKEEDKALWTGKMPSPSPAIPRGKNSDSELT